MVKESITMTMTMATKSFVMLLMTLALLGVSYPGKAQLPIDPTIVHGSAIIHSTDHQMLVINSPNTILDWQSFSVGAGDSIYFQQQDITSHVLNRVTSNDPSQIFGSLSSNGNVWLISPYGVLFGPDARINVAGLVASTLDISNIDFLTKRYHFDSSSYIGGEIKNQGEIRTSSGGRVWLIGDRIHNEGLVQTPEGQIALAAGKSVELVDSGAPNVIVRLKAPSNETVNLGLLEAFSGNVDLHGSIVNQEGLINANSVSTNAAGHIVLMADQVKLASDSQTQADKGTIQLGANTILNNWGDIRANNVTFMGNDILQQGQVTAQGGKVSLLASASIHLEGLIDVSNSQGAGGNIQVTTDKFSGMAGGVMRADGEQAGHMQIENRGLTVLSSTLVAVGSEQGGKIEVTGDQVFLRSANIDASGGMQGGTVHLGGGWQGGGNLAHAREVLIDAGSNVRANGGANIDAKGGEIVVWSTQVSDNNGLLQANEGGRIEFSSKGEILRTGNLQAGIGGTLLLDPKNIIITDNPPQKPPAENPPPQCPPTVTCDGPSVLNKSIGSANITSFSDNSSETSYISPRTIESVLERGTDVVLQADNDIKVQDAISAFRSGDFQLQAGRNITFDAGVTLNNDNIDTKSNFIAIAGDVGANSNFTDGGTPTLTINNNVTLRNDFGNIILAAVKGNFINNSKLAVSDVPGFDGNSQLLIFARDPSTSTIGELSNFNLLKQYNHPFDIGVTPTDGGNWVFYSDPQFLFVAPNSQTITYGDTFLGSIKNIRGFVDGDTINTVGAVVGTGVVSSTGPVSSSGNLTAGVHDLAYSTGFTSDLGYQFKDDTSSINELSVSQARLTYVADSAVRVIGQPLTDLSGQVIGFVDGDTLANAATGNLIWTTPAAITGPVGTYPVHGNGLITENYVLIQAAANETALKLQNLAFDPQFRQPTVDTGIQALNAGTTGARSVPDRIYSYRVIDQVTAAEFSTINIFARTNLSKMNRSEQQQYIADRERFKEKLFADAIYKLEQDPRLSDVQVCSNLPEIDLGLCRISDSQRDKRKLEIAKEQQHITKNKYKTRMASIPQIKRKFVVLFGLDHYADQSIPSLENAISDAEGIGKLFANKLGYEIRVIKNASRAEMIRTLNQLSIEMGNDDSVAIYYAGHGYMNRKSGVGYWIPADASAKNPESWISNKSVSEMLSRIDSKQIIMISDSCYSGVFTKEQQIDGSNVNPNNIFTKRAVVAMSSGGDEPVADEGKEGHSIFAWFLIQALQNVDNWRVGSNIFEQVRRNVRESFPQEPHLGGVLSAGHEDGDYFFEFRQIEELR